MRQWRTMMHSLWRGTCCLLALALLFVSAMVLWLYFDAHRERGADWFETRKGNVVGVTQERLPRRGGFIDERVRLVSDSKLSATARVLRPDHATARPLVLLLGGHRTGAAAVELFGDPGERVIVAFDYPVDIPLGTGDIAQTLRSVTAIRRASLDIAPAIGLTLDWLLQQAWADTERVTMVGVSLGVPFATTAAVHDPRIDALMLVHGAADNQRWIAHNLERRVDAGLFLPALASLSNWIIYGPLHDTGAQLASMAPRPVSIIGARADERVPAGETEALFAAAREPRTLHWTAGQHVTPSRRDVLDALMRYGDELLTPSE